MNSTKYRLFLTMVVSVSLFTIGCGNKLKETIGEKVLEETFEEEVEVNIDGDEGVSFETEDGSLTTGENLKWPDNMGTLPAPDAAIYSITESISNDATTALLTFNQQGDAEKYMEKLNDLDYVQRSLMISDGFVMYTGVKKDNTTVDLMYDSSTGDGSIMLKRNDEEVKAYLEGMEANQGKEEVASFDPEDSMDWPKDSMDNIPELTALITGVIADSGYADISFSNISKKDILLYVEEVKAAGFGEAPTEMYLDNSYMFSGSNSQEHLVTINWEANAGNLTYIKP